MKRDIVLAYDLADSVSYTSYDFLDAFYSALSLNVATRLRYLQPREANDSIRNFAEKLKNTGMYSDPVYRAHNKALIDKARREQGILLIAQDTNDYPFAICVGSRGNWHSSGVLIDDRTVLTARHSLALGVDEVFLGPDTHAGGQIIRVASSSTIKSDNDMDIDLAVLHLESSCSGVGQLTVASSAEIDECGWVRVIGYGMTDIYGTEGAGRRRAADIATVRTSCDAAASVQWECAEGREMVIGPNTFVGTCSGDSGAPLVILSGGRWLLVGIVSGLVKGNGLCGGSSRCCRIDAARNTIAHLLSN